MCDENVNLEEQVTEPVEPKVETEPLFEEMVDFDTFSKSDFRVVKVKECSAVKKSKKLLHFAHDLRNVVEQGIENGVRQISAPFSTRTLLKIAALLSVETPYTVHKIIKMCFALRLPDVEHEYVMRLCNDIFGHEKQILKVTQKSDLGNDLEVSENNEDLCTESDSDSKEVKVEKKSRRRSKNSTDKEESVA